MKEKTAKEMFEELGYKLMNKNKREIWYKKDKLNITFIVQDKYYCIYSEDRNNTVLDIKEHKAINHQVSELGWK